MLKAFKGFIAALNVVVVIEFSGILPCLLYIVK